MSIGGEMDERAREFLMDAGFPPNTPMFNDLKAKLVEFASMELARAEKTQINVGGNQTMNIEDF
jgi:hypothetical protein